MKKYVISALLLSLWACSPMTKVSYDYDSKADFAKYKTYAFSEGSEKMPINDLNRRRIIAAVENEMTAKGFTKSENPDVLVDLVIRAEQKVDATATSTGPGYGYGGRYGYGGGFSTTHIDYNEYVDGTLFINLVDVSAQTIIWQGRATKTLDEDASTTKREKNINDAVKQIFTKYPPPVKK
jgi:hypothetical protein